DLVAPGRNISTVNNLVKLMEAFNTHKWTSPNENVLTEASENEALVSAIFGIDPERVSDAFNQIGAMQGMAKMKSDAGKAIVADYRRMIQAMRSGNHDEAAKFAQRWKARAIQAGLDKDLRLLNRYIMQAIDEEPLDASVLRNFEEMFRE